MNTAQPMRLKGTNLSGGMAGWLDHVQWREETAREDARILHRRLHGTSTALVHRERVTRALEPELDRLGLSAIRCSTTYWGDAYPDPRGGWVSIEADVPLRHIFEDGVYKILGEGGWVPCPFHATSSPPPLDREGHA